MTREAILQRFPRASEDFIRKNLNETNHNNSRPSTSNPKQYQRDTLECAVQGEETCWYGAAQRFEIIFHVYGVNPADWDGYHIKELQDLCVKAGILPDDKWSVLRGRIYPQKVGSKEQEATVIEIMPE